MTPKKSVTIRDVARKAGVSPGTVSRAINNSPLVNEETRRRIMEVDVPIVLIDADHPALTMFHRLTVDNVAGGQTATELIVRGTTAPPSEQ